MDFVVYAIPFFLVLIVAEAGFSRLWNKNYYRFNDTVNSLSLGIISTTSKLVVIDLSAFAITWVQQRLSLPIWQEVHVWQWLAAFIFYDLSYYWFHRISHERKIFWAAHVAHHQSEEYNLSTALRQTSMSFILSWVFYIPCFMLGMPAYVFVSVASINLIYQFWVHTRFIGELGPLEKILVTPSNHRVHHARNPAYLDKNYGGVFIVWDRLFGTYLPERAQQPVDYGITSGLDSWNPLWANVHVYWSMLVNALATRRWGDKLQLFWGRTTYSPADIAAPVARPGNRYDPPLSTPHKIYIGAQFLIAAGLGVALKFNGPQLLYWQAGLLFAYLVFALLCLGWLLESRAVLFEYLRLLLLPIVVGLVSAPYLPSALLIAILSLLCFSWLVKNSSGQTSILL